MKKALVTGGAGFIGHHLVRYLKQRGYWVRSVDIREPEFSDPNDADEFRLLDLRNFINTIKAVRGIDEVYALAANMGGIGFISSHTSDVLHDNVKINANTAEAAKRNGVERLFYSSSACVYPISKQKKSKVTALKESDAYPADPDNEYGWEKLFSERLYASYKDFYKVRTARFHNIFGEEGTYEGGREKAPAAICRKIAQSDKDGTVTVWGDGKQTRSFCYIGDCLDGIYRLAQSDVEQPLNIGSDRLVTINKLVDIVSDIANKQIKKAYDRSKPQGVRGRNSDNTLCKRLLKWQPKIKLETGLEMTYRWVKKQL